MPERPKPSEKYILEFGRRNKYFLECSHHGIYELPLDKFYPFLNFDEMLPFAADAWKQRNKDITTIRQLITFPSKPEIFHQIMEDNYFSYLLSAAFCPKNREEFIAESKLLNPFKSETLTERLFEVGEENWKLMQDALHKKVNTYLFKCNYNRKLRQNGMNRRGLVRMDFLDKYPCRETNSPKLAVEISRMLGDYPTDYVEVKK